MAVGCPRSDCWSYCNVWIGETRNAMIRKLRLLAKRVARFGIYGAIVLLCCVVLYIVNEYDPVVVSADHEIKDDRTFSFSKIGTINKVSSDGQVLTPESEGNFMIRMEKRMAQRRLRVKKKCEELGIWQNITNYNLENIPNPKPWMFLSEQYKLMYCEIPKSGCTNWKKVLMVLNGIVNSTDGIKQGQAHTQSLKMLRSVPRSERDKLYQSGTKLMVVRQPFERLVSAYQDKVAARPPHNDSIFFQFSSEVAKKYGRQRKDTEPTTLNDGTRSITVCPVGEANLECSGKWEVIHITSALYGRKDNTTCVPENLKTPLQMCEFPQAGNIAAQVCNGKKKCQLVASAAQFQRTTVCSSTPAYLSVQYKCLSLAEAEMVTFCQMEIGSIQCPAKHSINVLSAMYGRVNDTETCAKGVPIYNIKCSSPTANAAVISACNGHNTCTVQATSDWIQSDDCPATMKYLKVWYTCEVAKSRRRRNAEMPRKKRRRDRDLKVQEKREILTANNTKPVLQPPNIYKLPAYIYRHKELYASFDEFVEYLLDPANVDVTLDNIDHGKSTLKATSVRHWQSYFTLCHPCHIHYDVIAHMETIIEDSEYLFKKIGAPKSLKYPRGYDSTGSSSTSQHSIKQQFSTLSLNAIKRLYQVYKTDFDLFDLEEPIEMKLVKEFLKDS